MIFLPISTFYKILSERLGIQCLTHVIISLINNIHLFIQIMETLEYRSNLTDVVIDRFTPDSVVANVTLVYDEVHYQDILLLEEALFVNNSFNGLDVKETRINSTSGTVYLGLFI